MSSLQNKELIPDGDAILTIESVSGRWSGTDWDVTKRCGKCNLAVFIHKGKDRDNCVSIVESKFAEHHKC